MESEFTIRGAGYIMCRNGKYTIVNDSNSGEFVTALHRSGVTVTVPGGWSVAFEQPIMENKYIKNEPA